MTPRTSPPPRIAQLLARLAAPRSDAEFVVGDLREAFDERAERSGIAAAKRWYRIEVARSVLPLLARRLHTPAIDSPVHPRGDAFLATTLADVRYALRLARRSPIASGAVVATMALGIGSTTAVFSAIDAVLLRPLPFTESSRVIELRGTLRGGQVIDNLAYPDLMDIRQGVPELSDLTVFQANGVTLQHGTDPKFVHTVSVDDAYARVFGARAVIGRLLQPSDMVLNAARVAVLSYEFWNREFGADRTLVGRTITIDDESVLVVGVLAPGTYTYPTPGAEALVPLIIQPNTPMTNRGSMWAGGVAKLRRGAAFDGAQRNVAAVARRIADEYPASNKGIGALAVPLQEAVVGSAASMLSLLAAAVAAVLLVACLNIANLLLGRAELRSQEFSIRAAIGGSPTRVRQQILTESLVLAGAGGLLGAALAPALTRALISLYPQSLPRANEIGIDGRVLLIAAGATIVAGMLSAMPTVRRTTRSDLARDLRDGGRSASGRKERRVGRVLIVVQVAASLALLFSAGLLLETFARVTRVSPGFNARNTTTFHVFASRARYRSTQEVARYFASATQALATIPGVTDVSSANQLPFSGSRDFDVFVQEERGDQGANNPATALYITDAGYERALGVPILRGRSFRPSDDSSAERVVVINEVLAKRNYAGIDPIGRLINWNGQEHWRIVGVAGSVRIDKLWEDAMPILYVPVQQAQRRSRYFVIRSSLAPDRILSSARDVLHRVDPTIAITDPATMGQRIDTSLGPQRFRAALMVALGALALGLAVIGIYSVIAYAVARRTREIGIRMALGEAASHVQWRVIADALGVASVGVIGGMVLSLLAGRWLTGFLVDVSPFDPRLLLTAAGVLLLVVATAAHGPARRAARVDPMAALRAD